MCNCANLPITECFDRLSVMDNSKGRIISVHGDVVDVEFDEEQLNDFLISPIQRPLPEHL